MIRKFYQATVAARQVLTKFQIVRYNRRPPNGAVACRSLRNGGASLVNS